jgi:chromate reductase
MTKVAVLVGSLQEKSFNKLLAKNLEELAPEGMQFEYIDLNLPLFNQDLEENFPVDAQKAKDIIEASDGVLFVTPEYNRSIPGVLKNAIDWISRPWGHNSFAGKPAGIVGATPSVVGTAVAQADLRHIVVYLGVKLLGQPEVYIANAHTMFDENGKIVEDARDSLKAYIDTFAQWIQDEE